MWFLTILKGLKEYKTLLIYAAVILAVFGSYFLTYHAGYRAGEKSVNVANQKVTEKAEKERGRKQERSNTSEASAVASEKGAAITYRKIYREKVIYVTKHASSPVTLDSDWVCLYNRSITASETPCNVDANPAGVSDDSRGQGR